MKLTPEIRKEIVDYWIKQGDENYLDIEWANEDNDIFNWKDRVKEIDQNIKYYAGDFEIERITYSGYTHIMRETCNSYLKGKEFSVENLKSLHKENELLEDNNGDEKFWKDWYQDIVNLNRDGKTSQQLNTFYKKLKKVETTSAKEGK